MNRKLEELLAKGEALKEGLEKELDAMGQTEAAETDKETLQNLRTNTLDQMEAAICGITALMAWNEDRTAQTNS